MKLIKLTLEGPLQSWGERGRWDARDTAAMPTKSAVIGLLGCCRGIPRESPELVQMSNALYIAVRCDKPGRVMTDFHTVQTGAGQGNFPNASGGYRTGDTILTPKQYLQDARFTVFLWGDHDELERCCQALFHPFWTPYLGRRSCVPSLPLLPEMIESPDIDTAISEGAPKGAVAYIELLQGDQVHPEERILRRRDSVINASRNEYRYRDIRVSRLEERKGSDVSQQDSP